MWHAFRSTLAIFLVLLYVGQSLFLGATHHHHPTTCGSKPRVDEHSSCCAAHGAPSSRDLVPEPVDHTPQPDPAGDSYHCEICRYLALSSLPVVETPEFRTEHVVAPVLPVRLCFVSTPPFSLPQPRSPPLA